MMDKTIINTHIHLFTEQHIPDRFLHPILMKMAKFSLLRKAMIWCIKCLPGEQIFLERYARFIEIAFGKSQVKLLELVKGYYPEGTKFVVLPMDMNHMGAGKSPDPIQKQHADLADLKKSNSDIIYAFFHADPRNPDVVSQLKECFDSGAFDGIKIYPPLGYDADSNQMKSIYEFANSRRLPIMAHCSQGGIRHKKISKAQASRHANPQLYESVMKVYPDIRFCLAHFAGNENWKQFRTNSWGEGGQKNNWLSIILKMLRSGEYPNLYVDISSTIFQFAENTPLLKVILSESTVADKVLFGSDFYMTEKVEFQERDLSIKLRAELGEYLFWKIANENPIRYLKKELP